MKTDTTFGLALLGVAIAFALWPGALHGQAAADDPLLTPLIEEITKQQVTIAENQSRVDEKLAVIAEDLRVARIFVGRGGGKAGK